MIRPGVKVQLLVFLLVTMIGVSILSAQYIGLNERLFGHGPTVQASFAQSGGIFVGSEVTYRGVAVGHVSGLKLLKDGVMVEAKLNDGTKIPKDTLAVVEDRSAVGEQYLDFQPRTDGGPDLTDGDVVPRADTRYPIRVDQLLQDVDDTVTSVNQEHLRTVVNELGLAFADGGGDLSRLVDNGDKLTVAATAALPQTIKLIQDGKIVLDTQRDTASQIQSFAKNFGDLSEALQGSDPDLRLVLDRGVIASQQLQGVIKDNQANLTTLIANLITVGQVTTSRIDGIQQMFVTYPEVVVGGYTVVPGDGTAHFGLQLSLTPTACTRGYEGTHKTEPAQTTNLPPLNTNARCTLPRGSSSDVRGAQNAPGVTRTANASFPMAYANQPVPFGTSAAQDPTTPQVNVPLAPDGGAGTDSWSWIIKEAAQ
jgi:phospholipid/cholesterol/gamma-HCH transport system substrate-binding protein